MYLAVTRGNTGSSVLHYKKKHSNILQALILGDKHGLHILNSHS